MPELRNTTVDLREVEHFSALAQEWWNPNGKFRPPPQVQSGAAGLYSRPDRRSASAAIRAWRALSKACASSTSAAAAACSASRWRGWARWSSAPTPSANNIEVAKLHAAEGGLDIDYRATTAETLAERGETFDVILNMEVVEHVADVELVPGQLRGDGEARRHHVRRHHKPHAEGARAGHHRRRICAALAATGHPQIWPSWCARKSSRRRSVLPD